MKNKNINLKLFIPMFFILIFNVSVFSDDWPCWRGPNHNGISLEKSWNPKALDNVKAIIWRNNVGKGHSALSVSGNYIFTMGNKAVGAGKERNFLDTVFCLNAKTGKEIWSYSFECNARRYPGPRTTPTVDGDYVYTLSAEGHLFCFHKKTGSIKWKKNIVEENLGKIPGWGFAGSPVIYKDLIILTVGKAGAALNKKTGKVIWKSENIRGSLPTPVLFKSVGKMLAAFPEGRNLNAVDIKTGKILWSHPRGQVSIDPIIFGSKILVPDNRKCDILDIGGDKPKLVNTFKNRFNAFLNFVVIDNYVYGFNNRGRRLFFFCMDLNDGKTKWKIDTKSAYASIIAADKKLIIVNSHGELIIAKANPESYQVISSLKVLEMADNKGLEMPQQCHCWITPVLANKKVYIRNNFGEIAAVDLSL